MLASFARSPSSKGKNVNVALSLLQRRSFSCVGGKVYAMPSNGIIGVRREDKSYWERRAPLAPRHVKQLLDAGLKVIIQPSTHRAFPDPEYEKVGAEIKEDLSEASLILGVKEVPISKLIADKSYMFFSHTHKGQEHNMSLLNAILEKNIRLLDYELLTEDSGRRLVRFGQFAGYAGMIDFLHLLGRRLLLLGHNSPFLNIGMAHTYRNLSDAKAAIESIGLEILRGGLPQQFSPFIFVFTGDGAVSKGAQDIFEQLPYEYILPSDIPKMVQSKSFDPRTVYGVVLTSKDYVAAKDGSPFLKHDYYTYPERYQSTFHEKIAPYVTALVNGIYWDDRYPRLLTNKQMSDLYTSKGRLLGIADISCDVGGSLEFMTKVTTIKDPGTVYNPVTRQFSDDLSSNGILMMTVDNLPAELSKEATNYFGNNLVRFVKELMIAEHAPPVLQRAVIADDGKLSPQFSHLADHIEIVLAKQSSAAAPEVRKTKRRALVLGSGMVVGPLLDYLGKQDVSITLGSILLSEARDLAKGRDYVTPMQVDVSNQTQLNQLIQEQDIVFSLVPPKFHPLVAESCIQVKKNLVTASYISPAMKALHERALEAGITILNEIGLDPGIDHLSAMKIIDEVKAAGGRIYSFSSVCGGLPAPEASDNSLAYKFSWSPRGVLEAGLNASRSRINAQIVETKRGELFKHGKPINVLPGFALECLPNRDSLIYGDLYGISDADTVFRGTLRYQGFSDMMQAMSDLGLFDSAEDPILQNSSIATWAQCMGAILQTGSTLEELSRAIRNKLEGYSNEKIDRIIDGFDRLGLFSDEPLDKKPSRIDTLCQLLISKLKYVANDRDMCIMQHRFGIEWSNGKKEEKTSTLVAYGIPGGYSSMAQTVAYPAAIAGSLLLDGHFRGRGVIAPLTADIYNPILQKLEEMNIDFVEKSRPLRH